MDTTTNTNDGQNDDADTSKDKNQQEKHFTQDEVNNMMAKAKANVEKRFTKQYEGVDVDEYTELKSAAEKAAHKKQVEKGEFETILQDQASKHKAEIAQYKTRETEYNINAPILNAAAASHAINPDQVRSLIKSDFKLSDTGDVEVIDSEGKRRYNNDGIAFTVEDRVREFLDSNPHFVTANPSTTNSQTNHEAGTQGELDITSLDMKNPKDREKYNEYRKKSGLAQ